ncbi:AbrB/MazE/SpoVT family DNA-binding domain-containing protein [Mesorhizobium sp. ArgA1]
MQSKAVKTAIHRLHDGSGALILPREILDGLKLQLGDQLEIIETGSGIVLTPVESTDVERQMRTPAPPWMNTRLNCKSWLCSS